MPREEAQRVGVLSRSSHSNDLMANNNADAYLPERYRQEIAAVNVIAGRRGVLKTLALTAVKSATVLPRARADPATAAVESALTPPGATQLEALKKRLAQAPRRRDFKAVAMIPGHQGQWAHEGLTEVLSYRPAPRQAWDIISLGGAWLNLMGNALNSQIWSFKH